MNNKHNFIIEYELFKIIKIVNKKYFQFKKGTN